MKTLRRLFRRLTSWSTSARDEELLRAEFEEHIAMQTAENLRAGLSPIEARRQALLKFGNVEAIKEAYRDQRGLPFIETLSRDTRHAIRGLRKSSCVHGCRHPDAGAWYWREHRHLCRDRQHPDPAPAISAGGSAGRCLAHGAGCARCPGTVGCSPSMYFTYREENTDLRTFRTVALR